MKRGKFLAEGEFFKLDDIDNEIQEYFRENKNKIVRPVQAFIIFETQEAKERCIKFFETSQDFFGNIVYGENPLKLLNHNLSVRQASDPTNILWENQSRSRRQMKCRIAIWLIAIILVFSISILLFTYLKKFGVDIITKFPQNTNCESIDKLFNGENS
jgi:hypothetical protein